MRPNHHMHMSVELERKAVRNLVGLPKEYIGLIICEAYMKLLPKDCSLHAHVKYLKDHYRSNVSTPGISFNEALIIGIRGLLNDSVFSTMHNLSYTVFVFRREGVNCGYDSISALELLISETNNFISALPQLEQVMYNKDVEATTNE